MIKRKTFSVPKIEFNDTASNAKKNRNNILHKISKVINSGIFLNGNEDKSLNFRLKKFFREGYFVTTASGHDSLLLSLQYFNLKSSDEIIFPANSYPTAFPVFLSGAKGIPTDVDENGQLDPNSLLKGITSKTKIVVVVHLYGLVGKLNEIIKICKSKNLILIEDCAQSFGTKYTNRYVGTFGDIGCFSFFPTKNLGTLGDGGGIFTKNKKIYEYFIKAKSYGEKNRFLSEFVSGHSRIPEIQASILNIYLKSFNKDSKNKKRVYAYFKKLLLSDKTLLKNISILNSDEKSDPLPHLFTISAKKRDLLLRYLEKSKIPTFIRYPRPVNQVPAFNNIKNRKFINSERLAKEILCLPFHKDLTMKNMQYIVRVINKFYTKK